MFGNGSVNWCMLGRAFLCRTMHFAIEPGFFVSNECYNEIQRMHLICTIWTAVIYKTLFMPLLIYF